jgi:hypothetical protein
MKFWNKFQILLNFKFCMKISTHIFQQTYCIKQVCPITTHTADTKVRTHILPHNHIIQVMTKTPNTTIQVLTSTHIIQHNQIQDLEIHRCRSHSPHNVQPTKVFFNFFWLSTFSWCGQRGRKGQGMPSSSNWRIGAWAAGPRNSYEKRWSGAWELCWVSTRSAQSIHLVNPGTWDGESQTIITINPQLVCAPTQLGLTG